MKTRRSRLWYKSHAHTWARAGMACMIGDPEGQRDSGHYDANRQEEVGVNALFAGRDHKRRIVL